MKVFIYTDSRGFKSKDENPWTRRVAKTAKHTLNNSVFPQRLTSLFHLYSMVKDQDKSDVIIAQLTYFEYVWGWPMRILKEKLERFDPGFEKHLEQSNRGPHPKPKAWKYTDFEAGKNALREIRSKCDHLILFDPFQMQAVQDQEAHMSVVHRLHSCVDHISVCLPINNRWRSVYYFDGIHYSEKGHELVAGLIERMLGRVKNTVNTYLV
jgi:hypothetical protein